MERQSKKIFKLIGSFLIIVFFLIGYSVQSQQDRENLEVIFLDVGQGDSILIKTPNNQNILIDGGPDKAVLSQLGRNLAFFDKKIDLIILTHPHSDHVTGLVDVLRRYQVEKVLMTGVEHNAPDYVAFLKEIEHQEITTEIVKEQKDLLLGEDLVLKILYPFNDLSLTKVENLNNTSIIAKLIYKNNSFLFTGDAEAEVEHELILAEVDLSAQVLKLGHHGSKSSSSQEFLNLVNPEYVVIQSGEDNNFGHPHLRTLKTLENYDLEILRNDLEGSIILISDGDNILVKK